MIKITTTIVNAFFEFDIIILRFVNTKVGKQEVYGAKKPIIIWYVDVDNTAIEKIIGTKNNCKYLIGYSDEVIKLLASILSKTTGNV